MRFIPLISSSSGNASYLEAGGKRILIDAGCSAKRLTELMWDVGLDAGNLDAIFVTHEHSDHVSGLAVFAKKTGTPVYITEKCRLALPAAILNKLPAELVRYITPNEEFFLGGARVLPFPTYHDAAEPVGYSVEDGSAKFTLLTDCGHVDNRLADICAESTLLFVESNHDEDMLLASNRPYTLKHRILSGKGHLSNNACAEFLVKLSTRGVRGAVLAHLSQECNTPDLARITVESRLRAAQSDMPVCVAKYTEPTGVFEIG